MFGNDRSELRNMYVQAWHKHHHKQPLEPIEAMICDVISMHPEYHALLTQGPSALDKDYSPELGETNPFLHMGLHIGIREQLATNRPKGIIDIHRQLLTRTGDSHAAEHFMMDCLAEMIWQAQRENVTPDEAVYMTCLRKQLP